MTYKIIMFLHLATILPCIPIGCYLILRNKRDALHKILGKIYMILMVLTALISLLLSAQVGPRLFNHFGYIHTFSFLTLYSVPTSLIAIRKGKINLHKRKMITLYISAIVIAGGFTLFPGRFLHELLFN